MTQPYMIKMTYSKLQNEVEVHGLLWFATRPLVLPLQTWQHNNITLMTINYTMSYQWCPLMA